MVVRQSHKIRIPSAFIVLFICLNAGGALCVAYCQGFDVNPAASQTAAMDHGHCGKAKESLRQPDLKSVAEGGECCPMTVSFIGAPIESTWLRVPGPAAVAVAERSLQPRTFAVLFNAVPTSLSYRGPPPRDRRSERIKQRLLLI